MDPAAVNEPPAAAVDPLVMARADHVDKRFTLRHSRSIKEYVIWTLRGRLAGLIEVGAGFHPDLTGRENVYLNGAILGMTKEQIDARFDDIVAFSEIGEFIDTEVKFYSSGMYLRLAFAVAVHTDPDVFLVDEILAVGDEPFQRKCIAKIKELVAAGKTLVVVSHDLDLVADICERGIVMERGRKVFDGPCVEAVAFLRGVRD